MNNTAIAEAKQTDRSLFSSIAEQWGVGEVEPQKLMQTLKSTAFKPVKINGAFVEVSNEQLMALMIIAKQYNLNPFTKEIYAFPAKDGSVVPVLGVDGWARIINSHPQLDGITFNYSNNVEQLDGAQPCPEWIECVIHRKDRKHPTIAREYLDECYRKMSYDNPWKTHTKRFLRHKALIQAARIAFGFAGIYDQDEARRVVVGQSQDRTMKDVSHVKELNRKYIDEDNEPERIMDAEEIAIEDDEPPLLDEDDEPLYDVKDLEGVVFIDQVTLEEALMQIIEQMNRLPKSKRKVFAGINQAVIDEGNRAKLQEAAEIADLVSSKDGK